MVYIYKLYIIYELIATESYFSFTGFYRVVRTVIFAIYMMHKMPPAQLIVKGQNLATNLVVVFSQKKIIIMNLS